jgi:hypothetical protein
VTTAEQIIGKLRTAKIELAKGLGTAEVVRKLEVLLARSNAAYPRGARCCCSAGADKKFSALAAGGAGGAGGASGQAS